MKMHGTLWKTKNPAGVHLIRIVAGDFGLDKMIMYMYQASSTSGWSTVRGGPITWESWIEGFYLLGFRINPMRQP